MFYRFTLITAIATVLAGGILANRRLDEPFRAEYVPQWACRRIVSMAPSITETLYALDLDDRVVGVSRFCEYPPQVMEITRVGGYFDPNLEAILLLKPDLVILLEEQAESVPALMKLDLETLVVNHQSIEGIIDSFRVIGRVCGRGAEGRQIARQISERLDWIRNKTKDAPRPNVLLVMDRTYYRGKFKNGRLSDIYVAAADKYFDALIEAAGGRNACRIQSVRNPVVSPEGIIWLDPDVIVELARPDAMQRYNRDEIIGDWDELPQVKAVKHGRVLVYDKSFACVPGPRFIHFLQVLARDLHPELDWYGEDP
ncbi:MAG: ABC transporter substrate-binding protein [Pirellulaceae bacterium]|nr:ABC transporter substrate-binding protein [Pirellulaceae bacterium]